MYGGIRVKRNMYSVKGMSEMSRREDSGNDDVRDDEVV